MTATAIVKWFGQKWGAPICEPSNRISPPVGWYCPECDQPISPQDRGLLVPHVSSAGTVMKAWHLVCFAKSVSPAPPDKPPRFPQPPPDELE